MTPQVVIVLSLCKAGIGAQLTLMQCESATQNSAWKTYLRR